MTASGNSRKWHDTCFDATMGKRAFTRVEADLPVKYYCDDALYYGTVKNLSEKGMFISTGNFLPCINCIELLVPLKKEIAAFSAQIKRIEKINDSIYVIGVELVDPPENYVKFVSSLRGAFTA